MNLAETAPGLLKGRAMVHLLEGMESGLPRLRIAKLWQLFLLLAVRGCEGVPRDPAFH